MGSNLFRYNNNSYLLIESINSWWNNATENFTGQVGIPPNMQEAQLRVLTAEECKRIYKEKYNGETDPSPSQICVIQSQSVCRVSDIFIWLNNKNSSELIHFVVFTGRQWRTFDGGYYPNRHCQLRRRLQLRSAPNLHPGFYFCRKRMDRWKTGKLKI